jgi:NAD-dependent dihydropyrimidine dehydrogenase PreA subunit
MITPEESQLLVEMYDWTTSQKLAKKLNQDENGLQTKLQEMVKKGLLRSAKEGYSTPPTLVSFHHGALGLVPREKTPEIHALWKDFFFGEQREMLTQEWVARKKTGAPSVHRVFPSRKALLASPNIRPDQILWYEDMLGILKKGQNFTVTPCGCRTVRGQCGRPKDVCLHFDLDGATTPYKGRPGKALSFEEAVATMNMAEEAGLVHVPLNTSNSITVCNCCPDCCSVINSLTHCGKVHEILSPSRYRAVVNLELCNGCQQCVERCYFDAVEMKQPAASKKFKSSIISQHCMGCGLCVFNCPQKALTLEIVRPPEHIPTIPREQLLGWGKGF